MATNLANKLLLSAKEHYVPIKELSTEYSKGQEVICLPKEHVSKTTNLTTEEILALRSQLVIVKIVVDDPNNYIEAADVLVSVNDMSACQEKDKSFRNCGLVKVLEFAFGSGFHELWYSMPLVKGCSLEELDGDKVGSQSPVLVCHIITSLYRAWKYLHTNNLQHGDWHGGNIMLTLDENDQLPKVTLIDYGSVDEYDRQDAPKEAKEFFRNLFVALGIWEEVPSSWRSHLDPSDLQAWEKFYKMFHVLNDKDIILDTPANLSMEFIWNHFGAMIERIAEQSTFLDNVLPGAVQDKLKKQMVNDDEIVEALKHHQEQAL
ncbi:hypothetical protein BDV96DRAFT_601370 [Lophiotrema nucula]|uniref:Protein kinase domain-containing protein n=1 Tax=Lophiotrema nucula TaxID=690887 RepID=A0A6A5Z276_9PLEO|nr:hypothetical protein BDV96DRAFT_601370 [Lophiotrema nucula]